MNDSMRRMMEHQARQQQYRETADRHRRQAEQQERMRQYYANGGQGLRGGAAVIAVVLWIVAVVTLYSLTHGGHR